MPTPGLTKQRIVAAALDVLDDAGLDGLTVRAVASRLGVQAPALYWHVKNKRDLLDEMSTELWRVIMREVDALPENTPWQDGMRAFASTTRRVILSHRDGAKVFSGAYLTDTAILLGQEVPLERMIADGFDRSDAVRASSLVYNFTIGFSTEEQGVQQSADDRYTLEARARRFDETASPLVVAAGREVFGDPDARFDELVDILIDAAERLRRR